MMAAFAVLAPRPALAHGTLKRSVPAAGAHLGEVPREIRLEFNEAPELAFTSVRLLSADGREIALGALAYAVDSHRAVITPIASAMLAGTYTVVWQMAGDDGHPIRGRFEFVVAPGAMGVGLVPAIVSPGGPGGAASAATSSGAAAGGEMHHDPASMPQGEGFGSESPLYVLIRWLQFIGLLLIIGASSFRFLVLPLLRRSAAAVSPLLTDAERRAATTGFFAAALLAFTLLLRLGAQSYAMHGGVFDLSLSLQMIRKTMWGWGWLIQLAGVILAGIGFQRVRSAARMERDVTAGWRTAALGAVVAAFAPAFAGHAASAPRMRTLAMIGDGMHILGASSWLGTLAIVLLAGLTAGAQSPPAERSAFAGHLIRAFSPVALASAALAASTGVFAAWIHVGTIPNLWSTRYGITLLVKLAILGVVAGTGFYNWRIVTPRLGTDDGTRLLRRSASVEVAIAVLVLVVTAVLVATPTSLDMDM